jgi:hypothetical protein
VRGTTADARLFLASSTARQSAPYQGTDVVALETVLVANHKQPRPGRSPVSAGKPMAVHRSLRRALRELLLFTF